MRSNRDRCKGGTILTGGTTIYKICIKNTSQTQKYEAEKVASCTGCRCYSSGDKRFLLPYTELLQDGVEQIRQEGRA